MTLDHDVTHCVSVCVGERECEGVCVREREKRAGMSIGCIMTRTVNRRQSVKRLQYVTNRYVKRLPYVTNCSVNSLLTEQSC